MKPYIIILTATLLTACSFNTIKIPQEKQTELFYLKISELEVPPQALRKNNTSTQTLIAEHDESTPTSQLQTQDDYSLIVSKPFNQSWSLIEKVLTYHSIPIKDRNRNQGIYLISLNNYLKSRREKESLLPFSLTDLFTSPESDQEIKIILTQQNNATTITAKYNNKETPKNTPDGQEIPTDESLIVLLKTINDSINSNKSP
jgi:hypothetical protein